MSRGKLLKRAQVWVLDVFFGILVFTVTLVIFFKASINLSEEDAQTFDDLLFESKLVGDSLMSRGSPDGWTEDNVSEIGITDNHRINETKLGRLRNLNYSLTKTRLRTKYDYYFFFEDQDGVVRIDESQEGVGKPGTNSSNIIQAHDPHNLVKMNRFVIFKSRPAKMAVYIWN